MTPWGEPHAGTEHATRSLLLTPRLGVLAPLLPENGPAAPLVSRFFTKAFWVQSGRRRRTVRRPDGRPRASPRCRRGLVDPTRTLLPRGHRSLRTGTGRWARWGWRPILGFSAEASKFSASLALVALKDGPQLLSAKRGHVYLGLKPAKTWVLAWPRPMLASVAADFFPSALFCCLQAGRLRKR